MTLEVGRGDSDAVAALLHGLPGCSRGASDGGERRSPHRRGIGTALLTRAEAELRADDVRYLQVKTLGPSRPDEEYGRTRLFYEARGFVALEEMLDVWSEDNPMLVMVKAL